MKDEKLHKLKLFYARHRRLPTYTEMLDLFNVASRNAVHWVINKWIEAGLLVKEGTQLAPTADFFAIPLLGTIPAGIPSIEEYYSDDAVSLDQYLVQHPGFTYALRVSGDSMINEGIHEGDLVIVDQKREARNGDIVAAYIDSAWTLKYLQEKEGRVFLKAANDAYSPLFPTQELMIGGVVVKVIKEYY